MKKLLLLALLLMLPLAAQAGGPGIQPADIDHDRVSTAIAQHLRYCGRRVPNLKQTLSVSRREITVLPILAARATIGHHRYFTEFTLESMEQLYYTTLHNAWLFAARQAIAFNQVRGDIARTPKEDRQRFKQDACDTLEDSVYQVVDVLQAVAAATHQNMQPKGKRICIDGCCSWETVDD